MEVESGTRHLGIDEIRTITKEVTDKNVSYLVNDEQKIGLIANLVSIVEHHRLYMLSDMIYFDSIWGYIRGDTALTDFVLNCTCDLRLRVANSQSAWNALIQKISYAFSIRAPSSTFHKSVIDEDVQDSLSENGTLHELLTANPWMVYILLLSTLSTEQLLGESFSRVLEQQKGRTGQ